MSTDPSMTITCDSDSNWDRNLSALCTKIVCPLTIPNGKISSACVGKRGYNQKCYSYECSSGYEKPRQAVTLTCNKSATWDWDKSMSESPCLNSKDFCPKIIRNGRIDQFCDRKHGSQCTFICNEGCTKYNPPDSSRFKLTCKDNGEWNVPSYGVCRNCAKTTTAITAACPASIPNGGIDPSCNNRHFHECHYHCVGAYFPKYERLYCTSLGYWENGAEACVDGRTPSSDEIKSSAPIIGGVVAGSLGVLAIIIVIVVICCIRGGPCKRSHEEPGRVITYHGVASNAPEGGVVPSAPNLSEMPSHEVRRTDAVTTSAPIDQIPGYEKPPPSYVEVVADPRKFNT